MCDCTPAPSTVHNTTKATVDGIYHGAVDCEEFYSRMLHIFGSDELAPQAIEAFSYARSKYEYFSPSELAEQAKEWAEDEDICGHGLDIWTCPAGCFEG
jgi:hypothetical protein